MGVIVRIYLIGQPWGILVINSTGSLDLYYLHILRFGFLSAGDSKAAIWSQCVQCLDDAFLKYIGETSSGGRPACRSWSSKGMGVVEGEEMDYPHFKSVVHSVSS